MGITDLLGFSMVASSRCHWIILTTILPAKAAEAAAKAKVEDRVKAVAKAAAGVNPVAASQAEVSLVAVVANHLPARRVLKAVNCWNAFAD